MVNFPTQIPDCDSDSPALLNLFISSNASVCSVMAFPPLGNSDHVAVSVSTDFPTNSKQDGPFHHIAYDYSWADRDGLCDHLRDGRISLNLVLLLLIVDFVSEFRLELMFIISLIINIRLSLIHLHGFQLLVLLPKKSLFSFAPTE